MRDDVVELQQAPLAAAPTVVCAKCAPALVTPIYFARDSGATWRVRFTPLGVPKQLALCDAGPSDAACGSLVVDRTLRGFLPTPNRFFSNSLRSASSPRFIACIRSPLGSA